jgi:hypothetical protein
MEQKASGAGLFDERMTGVLNRHAEVDALTPHRHAVILADESRRQAVVAQRATEAARNAWLDALERLAEASSDTEVAEKLGSRDQSARTLSRSSPPPVLCMRSIESPEISGTSEFAAPAHSIHAVEMLRSDKGTVGLKIIRSEGVNSGPWYILDIAGNSPAEKAGCRIGDAILAIDGQSVLNLGHQETAGLLPGLPNSGMKLLLKRTDVQEKVAVASTSAQEMEIFVKDKKSFNQRMNLKYKLLQQERRQIQCLGEKEGQRKSSTCSPSHVPEDGVVRRTRGVNRVYGGPDWYYGGQDSVHSGPPTPSLQQRPSFPHASPHFLEHSRPEAFDQQPFCFIICPASKQFSEPSCGSSEPWQLQTDSTSWLNPFSIFDKTKDDEKLSFKVVCAYRYRTLLNKSNVARYRCKCLMPDA